MKKITGWLGSVSCAVLMLIISEISGKAQVIYQADFNGAGSGTGEASNISTFGGTASLASGTNLTASIASSSLLFSGASGYLHLNDTGTGSGAQGVTVLPRSAAHSLDAWYSAGSSFVSLNGAIDFFFRDSNNSTGWGVTGAEFRPLDISGGNGGLRFIINSFSTNRLQAELVARNASGTLVQDIRACPSSGWEVQANTLYHVAVAISTNGSTGIVTMKIYLAPGNVAINPLSNTYLLATAASSAALPSTGTNAITHAFNSASGFTFGQYNNPSDTKTLDFGALRIYSPNPVLFPAVAYLPDVAHGVPTPEPTLPSGFDLFSPPVGTGSPASGTPVGGEWTRMANAGDGLVVAGNNLSTYTGTDAGKDSAFLAFGENGNFLAGAPAAISRENGNNAAIQLDPGLPANSVYLLWPRNANGYGTPMILNKAEAWWIGANITGLGSSNSTPAGLFAPGSPVSLYGRNLTSSIAGSASSISYIYIKPQGTASGQWVTPTAANPYKVDFTIPSGLAAGTTYEVWAHNGHGEHYGWAGPVLLTVQSASTWSGPTYNVKTSYGAYGDGTHDDTTAIQNAINAAGTSSNSTVYIPTGTYLVRGLTVPPDIRINGDGPTASILEFASTATGGTMLNLQRTTVNITVSNLGLSANNSVNTYLINSYGVTGGTGVVSGFNLVNCVLSAAGHVTPVPTETPTASAFAAGATSLSVSSATGLAVGQVITGTGLPGNEKISSISGTTIGLTAATTAAEPAETITQAGNPFGNPNEGTYYFDVCNHLYLENDTFLGSGGIVIIDGQNCAVDHCSVAGAYDAGILNIKGYSSEMSYTNDTCQDYDNYLGYAYVPSTSSYTGDSLGWGWNQGPFFKGLNGEGARHNTYIGNNTSYNMGMRIGAPGVWGEQISNEQDNGQFAGSPSSATTTSVTFSSSLSGVTTNTPLIAVIVNGTGQGQWRDVSSISGNTVTLAAGESWNVVPDTTSTVALGWYVANVVSYENTFSGKVDRVGPPRSVSGYPGGEEGTLGITGFLPYGGVLNGIADSNTYNYAEAGINTVSMVPRDTTATYVMPDYFHLCINNTMNDCQTDIAVGLSASFSYGNTLNMAAALGDVYRNNVGSDATAGDTLWGVQIQSQPNNTHNALEMLLFEQNSLTDLPVGVNLFDDWSMNLEGDLLFESNNITEGSTTSAAITGATSAHPAESGSYAIDTPSGVLYGLGANTWSGFGSVYVDGTAAPILEEPIRTCDESASLTVNTPATDVVTVWNSGTASLSWTATSDSSWLTVSPASGTGPVEDEPNPSSFTITCSPSGLSAGLHTGNITLTSGSQTKKILVNFTVNP